MCCCPYEQYSHDSVPLALRPQQLCASSVTNQRNPQVMMLVPKFSGMARLPCLVQSWENFNMPYEPQQQRGTACAALCACEASQQHIMSARGALAIVGAALHQALQHAVRLVQHGLRQRQNTSRSFHCQCCSRLQEKPLTKSHTQRSCKSCIT